MALLLGCIADDFTGAADLSNTLTRNGLRTVQLQGIPSSAGPDLPEVDAIVIALKSRSIEPDGAVLLALLANDWLRKQAAAHVMFKICSTFDSTDRGNIGPVIDSLRSRHGNAVMPVTPAFPATGRTVYKGHLFVGNDLLSESPLRDHPLNPMRDSNLMRLLARQSRHPVGLADTTVVEAGSTALRQALEHLANQGTGSVIIDATCERHLEAIGVALLESPISTGASGLGLGLARALIAAGRRRPEARFTTNHNVTGEAAMIAASCSRATLEQIAEAEPMFPVRRVTPDELFNDESGTIKGVVAWAARHVERRQPLLIATSADRASVERAQSLYGLEATARVIEDALAVIAAELVNMGVRKLVIAGGETSGAIVTKLGIRACLIGPEVTPGVPVLYTVGSTRPMSLVLKSGNFGARTFFADALREMKA